MIKVLYKLAMLDDFLVCHFVSHDFYILLNIFGHCTHCNSELFSFFISSSFMLFFVCIQCFELAEMIDDCCCCSH